MNLRRISATTMVGLAVSTAVPAQDAYRLALIQDAVVHVSSPRGKDGSGIVIGSDAEGIRVITARHVVEGEDPRPNAPPEEKRRCDVVPRVTFQSDRAYPVTTALCSDESDLALLEIAVDDRALVDRFPKLHEPGRLADSFGQPIVFVGRPQGKAPARSDGNSIVQADAKQLETKGLGVHPGFSGGAAIDATLGLAGMVVQTDGMRTYCLPWQAIDEILTKWDGRANRLEGGSGSPNPAFHDPRTQEVAKEGARNAIRRYQKALTARNRDALRAVYPTIGRGVLDALFGDAYQIDLTLVDCGDVDARKLSCIYELKVYRRTARLPTILPPGDQKPAPRMLFQLHPGEVQWEIVDIQEIAGAGR